MKLFWSIGMLGLWLLSGLWGACSGTDTNREICLTDSLNEVAYAMRYKDLEVSKQKARQAYEGAHDYDSGKAEACNHLGFAAFMAMDFVEAERYYKEVYSLTRNELEWWIADVGMMKICQRKALNKEFYDYRNRAERRMKRILEEADLFVEPHERRRLHFAQSEFYIVSAVYYYYLQQQEDALACIRKADIGTELKADTNQLLYYHYIRGAAELGEEHAVLQRKLKAFDELYATWRMAALNGYHYFEGNGLQGLANLLAVPADYELLKKYRNHALLQFEWPLDALLPLRLGQQALLHFKVYQDPYQIAGAYVSIGKCLNAQGYYTEALDTLTKALDEVNGIQGTAPECISRICEQMSVSYAGLGQKEESDMHRNIYLDILEDTRQDKEWESRSQALEEESEQLNGLLVGLFLGLLGVILFFIFFNQRSKKRSKHHVQRLQWMLDMCQQITSSIPAEAQTEEEILVSIEEAIRPTALQLFGTDRLSIQAGKLCLDKKLNREEQAMVRVFNPYIQWALDNGMTAILLGDERKKLEKQRYVYEQHIAGNKRQNIVKKACLAIVNGIHPYLDRMINEIQKVRFRESMQEVSIKKEKYQYIEELVTTIHEYNEILALWIQMKRGSLSLNIETFALDDLFDLLRKGSRAFEWKKQTLEVVQATGIRVKADKALTLFMLNTLAENARKYTPQGGCIQIFAQEVDHYVEVSVADNGYGLSTADVAQLNGEKVYDSSKIGWDTAADREDLRQKKGSGFGLMNCKGIIEKYRKTNALFQVCAFGVESRPGKGSRFYFRLPVGILKVVVWMVLGLGSCLPVGGQTLETGGILEPEAYEVLLDSASDYANEAYYANVEGEYEWALQYIDSAMACLNRHYQQYAVCPQRSLVLCGVTEQPAELDWWKESFRSDYHVILDIRNEAAVAFLALKQWEAYRYNNGAYTALYKLLGEDQSLEEYCRQLQQSTRNKRVGMILGILWLVALLLGYYVLYVRKRLVNCWNLEEVLDINRQVFAAAQPVVADREEVRYNEDYGLQAIPQKMVDGAFEEVRDLLEIDGWGIAVFHEEAGKLEYAFRSVGEEMAEKWLCRQLMQRCWEEKEVVQEENRLAVPLWVEAGGKRRCVGVLCLESREGGQQETGRLLSELIARYVAIVAFNAVVKLANKYRDIETAEDEARRASWEDNMLHVQNLVLDNCLSTIKHETVYYPNKIKQLVRKLRQENLTEAEEQETVAAMDELSSYYKSIFSILSQCASRQLEEVTFRRTSISLDDWMQRAEKYFKKGVKASGTAIALQVSSLPVKVVGDRNLLDYLLENLIDEALAVPIPGQLELSAELTPEGVKCLFTDYRRTQTQEELNRLFYPSLQRLRVDERGQLRGTEFLIAKQIIREHDEHIGLRGYRINAWVHPAGGFTVYFTLTRADSLQKND